jgi:hypothetical protein
MYYLFRLKVSDLDRRLASHYICVSLAHTVFIVDASSIAAWLPVCRGVDFRYSLIAFFRTQQSPLERVDTFVKSY